MLFSSADIGGDNNENISLISHLIQITVKLYSCGLWKYKTQTKEYKNKSELFYDLRHDMSRDETRLQKWK